MKTLKLTFLFLIIDFYSCGQKQRSKINSESVRLNNKIIPLLDYLDNSDSCKKALSFLDSATTIDNNCFLCYYNKIMFLSALKEFDKAIIVNNNCIRLRPNEQDLYLTGGVLYEKTGDAISSRQYFQKSLSICDAVLDTMKVKQNDEAGQLNYDGILLNKAINIIMLGDSTTGNKIIADIYKRQNNNAGRDWLKPFMNKSRADIIRESFTDKLYSR